MKTLRSHAVGGPETLTLDEVADSVAAPGQVVVAVKVCAINFPDTLMIRDMYQFKPQRPYAPGGEFAGVVESVGEGVTQWKVGDRVIGMCGNGGLAQKVALDAARMFPLPDGVSFETGASLLMTYGTTIHGLKDRGRIKAGETMLVLGAAGGVGRDRRGRRDERARERVRLAVGPDALRRPLRAARHVQRRALRAASRERGRARADDENVCHELPA